MPRLRSARRCRASRAWMLWKTTRREEMTASASSAPAAGASSASGPPPPGGPPPPPRGPPPPPPPRGRRRAAGGPAGAQLLHLVDQRGHLLRQVARLLLQRAAARPAPALRSPRWCTMLQVSAQAVCSTALRRIGWISSQGAGSDTQVR